MKTIDINSDLGEGFGPYAIGDDDGMLAVVTTANVACGMHGGDPEIMARVFARARDLGIAVGAHPGFPDLWGFGRRRIPFTAGEIERLVAYQVGAAQALAAVAGHRIGHVKTHGALGNIAETDADVAAAVARAVRAVDSSLTVLGIGLSAQLAEAEKAGLATVAEIYADRGYTDEGRLIPRGRPGALITEPEAAATRVLEMLEAGAVISAGGVRLPLAIGSVCIHGETPNASAIGRTLRTFLHSAGWPVAPFAPPDLR